MGDRDIVTKALIALVGASSVTVGQYVLLYLLFPQLATRHGPWILLGLLGINLTGSLLLLVLSD